VSVATPMTFCNRYREQGGLEKTEYVEVTFPISFSVNLGRVA
jgi:hypothetical protein